MSWNNYIGQTKFGEKGKPDDSAIVDFDSTAKGILFPRMTTIQRNGITSPANGLIIFNTDKDVLQEYHTSISEWKDIGKGGIGPWNTAAEYIVDDVVYNDYRIYICLVTHTATDFATDMSNGYWKELSRNYTFEEIKTLYESNPDTNAFTDADKANLDKAFLIGGNYITDDVLLGGNAASNENHDVRIMVGGAVIFQIHKNGLKMYGSEFCFRDARLYGVRLPLADDEAANKLYVDTAVVNRFTDAEKSKLAALESSKYLGEYSTLADLQTAYPTANAGEYANVDGGVGVDAERYIWDFTDNAWVKSSAALTAAETKVLYETNSDTNAFTDAEKTKLAGIEDGATADQTASEIKASYESNLDTNAYTDADKTLVANSWQTDGSNTGTGTLILGSPDKDILFKSGGFPYFRFDSSSGFLILQDINANNKFITNLPTPTNAAHAANKDYVDTSITTHSADTSTHGVTEVLGSTEAQVASNKSIEDPSRLDVKKDTVANLTTYATTATNGQLCFATDEKKMYQVIDGALSGVGGSGVGSPSLYLFLDADNIKATDFTSNLVTGTFTEDTTEANNKRYKLTNAVGASGDVVYTQTLFSDAKSRRVHMVKIYNSEYTGTKGNVTLVISDQLDNVLETVVIDPAKSYQSKTVSVPDTVTAIKVKPTIVTAEASTWVFDKIALDYDPLGEISVEKKENYNALIRVVATIPTISSVLNNSLTALLSEPIVDGIYIKFSAITKCFVNLGFGVTATNNACWTDVLVNGVSQGSSSVVISAGSPSIGGGSYNLELKAGDVVSVKVENQDDTSNNPLSITASATSDQITIEDEREQAHVVASLRLEGCDGRVITPFTESIPFNGTSPFWTSGADGSTPANGNYYTVQGDGNIVSISVSSLTDTAGRRICLHKNGTLYKMITSYSGGGQELHGSYVSSVGEFSKGDKLAFTLGDLTATTYSSLDSIKYHYLNITETYIPPSDQATQPIVLSAPKQYENDYRATLLIDGSTTNNPTIIKKTHDFIDSVTFVSDRRYNIDFTKLGLTTAPYIDVDMNCAASDASRSVNAINITNTGAQFLINLYDNVSYELNLTISRAGADRRDAGVIGVGNVTPTKVMIVEDRQPSSTSGGTGISATWTTRNLTTLRGDKFGTLSLNQVTIPAGEYDIEISSQAFDCNAHSCRLRDITNGVTLLSSRNAYATNSTSDMSEAIGKGRISIDSPITIELQYWMAVAGGTVIDLGVPVGSGEDEIYGTIKITKLS